jgi:hypothetical protein
MWTIAKIEKKKINLLKSDLSKKLGSDFQLYNPKVILERYSLNKLKKKEVSILGNYIFCHHRAFSRNETISNLKFCRGLKYFLNGFLDAQNDISEFVNKCKALENSKGYLSQNIFNLEHNKSYKFATGPFVQKIFKIIRFQKNTIDIEMGNLKTKINKKSFLFNPI